MPVSPTYPGVYIQELPSQVHPITGVTTADTAFIDYFPQGPVGEAVMIESFAAFQQTFGGINENSESSYQISQFFLNGGSLAWVVRVVPREDETAEVNLISEDTILPATISLGPGQQQQFLETIEGSVTWSLGTPTPTTAPGAWAKGQYSVGQTILDSKSHIQACTTAGTTGASEPTSFNDNGGTTPDGTVTWTDAGLQANLATGTQTAGLYTAPSSILLPYTVTITATNTANCKDAKTATITLAPVTVTVSQVSIVNGSPVASATPATAAPGDSIQLAATVAGNASQTVTWSLLLVDGVTAVTAADGLGSINPTTGQYVAPTQMPYQTQIPAGTPATPGAAQTATTAWPGSPAYTPPVTNPTGLYTSAAQMPVIACATFTCLGQPTVNGFFTINLEPVRINPGAGVVIAGQGICLTAMDGNLLVSGLNYIGWYITAGDPGTTTTGSGPTYCYQPSSQAAASVTVTCVVSEGGSTPFYAVGTATIQVVQDFAVSASQTSFNTSPAPVTIGAGASTQLSAWVFGDPLQQITWTLGSGMPGVINPNGEYEAPISVPGAITVTVTASSTAAAQAGVTSNAVNFNITVNPPAGRLTVTAQNPGAWGNQLQVAVIASPTNPALFSLKVQLVNLATGVAISSESYTGLTMTTGSTQYAPTVVNAVSQLITLIDNGPGAAPAYPFSLVGGQVPADAWQNLSGGIDGAWNSANSEFTTALINAVNLTTSPLLGIAPQIFNILCIPAAPYLSGYGSIYAAALDFCKQQRAFYIVDIPPSQTIPNPTIMSSWFLQNLSNFGDFDNGAVYYPRIQIADPLNNYLPKEIGVSGTLAGVYASTDLNRGVWKAPAGTTAPLVGATPTYPLKDIDSGILNPLGICGIRNFTSYGVVSWGARTLQGSDEIGSQWKYIPVRRLAYYIETSLYEGLQWAVFEPNAEPLWAAIRQSVTTFMSGLFQQGAFFGSTPSAAFFVTCDNTTTSQANIDAGIVNIIVGFAPLKPAEFVIVQITQIAGQTGS